MAGRLAGKVAVVTGSTAGIGRASAELFAEEGAAVVINGRREALGAEVVAGIQAAGGQASFCPGDMGVMDDVRGLIRYTLDTYGRIDVLMNNAYSGGSRGLLDMTETDWDHMYNIMLKASIVACTEAIPAMIEQGGGSIINVSSVHGILAGRSNAPYNTFKAALVNLTRQLAVDFGRDNVRVNALGPGRIVTESKVQFLDARPDEVRRQQYTYPLGRPGTMRECANAALFLASDASSFVTGHLLMVDGGLTAQLQDSVSAFVEKQVLAELGIEE